ncbi:hypothetical protein SXCC_02874 [Gluconacetobacter sp. SXCC-1]|nr:hypothetical protein SXCC_02874 [Gluconacetobacter sp. SXCC-1]
MCFPVIGGSMWPIVLDGPNSVTSLHTAGRKFFYPRALSRN